MLLIEDDDGIADAVGELLADEGFATRRARDGGEALELLRREGAPCLILLDLLMPGIGGKAFLKRRGDDYPAAIPIAVFTAVSELSFSMPPVPPVEGILRKPVDPAALLGVVRKYCTRA